MVNRNPQAAKRPSRVTTGFYNLGTDLPCMKTKMENALPPGYALRQYRIVRTLSGGGFSIVYLADDPQRQQQVVIKEYLPSSQARRGDDESVETLSAETDASFRQGINRFFDEGETLTNINHQTNVRRTE